jgi:amidase
VGPLGADVAAVELGMRLIEPGFTAGSCELAVGRLRLDAALIDAALIDPAVDAAVDAALAAAGLRVVDVTGLDVDAVGRASDVIIDVEAYQANAYLMPQLDRLSPHLRRNMTESAKVTGDQLVAANRLRQEVRDWFARTLARHPFVALPTLPGPAPLLGERGMRLTLLTIPANLAGLPALALPVPGGPAGLPASLQLIGPPGGEEQLIALGRIIEAALPE